MGQIDLDKKLINVANPKRLTGLEALYEDVVRPVTSACMALSQTGKELLRHLPDKLYRHIPRDVNIRALFWNIDFGMTINGRHRTGPHIGFRPFAGIYVGDLPKPTLHASRLHIEESLDEQSALWKFNTVQAHLRGHNVENFATSGSVLGNSVYIIGMKTTQGYYGNSIGDHLALVVPQIGNPFWFNGGQVVELAEGPKFDADLDYDIVNSTFISASEDIGIINNM